MLIILAACTPEPITLEGPEVVQPSPLAPYARKVEWTLDREVTVRGVATDGVHTIPIASGPAREHTIPLVGLYADAEWRVDLVAIDDRGGALAPEALMFRTDPLPEPFPTIELRVAERDQVEPGLTLMPLGVMGVAAWLVAIDADGQVAWLYDGGYLPIFESRPVPGGVRFLHGLHLVEVDWFGVDRVRLSSEGPFDGEPGAVVEGAVVEGAEGFNHDFTETDDGHWLAIGKEFHTIASFPVSYDDPARRATVPVNSDQVLEIDPERAEVVRRWSTYDHLDHGRIGYGSLDPAPLGFDWTHANAISTRGDDWLLSLRHQDAVVLFDGGTGEIRYILGPHDNWSEPFRDLLLEPVGEPFEWQWHQHAAKLVGDDRILLFDNGNYQASPWTGVPKLENAETRSRVVQYAVDRQARTVRQEWAFELDPTVYSAAMGDADLLPNGHVLATFAYVLYEGGISNSLLGRGTPSARVVELDPADGRVLWDLDVWTTSGDPDIPGWQVFRAERFERFALEVDPAEGRTVDE